MIRISGFKTRKARQFNYIPRYYDEEQEARDARKAKNDKQDYKPGMLVRNMKRERYQTNVEETSSLRSMAKTRTIRRSVIILLLLGLTAYIIVNSTVLETIFTAFLK